MNTAALIWETVGGAAIMALVLIDVFLTVLYARIGYSIFSRRIARSTWWFFRQLTRGSGRSKGRILSFAGPTILVLLVASWAFGLSAGAALIVHERLGRSIVAQNGKSATDWVTALFVGNASLSIVSSSGYSPDTPATRLLYVANSIIGASVLSLSLTYLMQVYSALNQRNALALSTHLSAGEEGDAAELIVGIGPRGRFEAASRALDEMSSQMVQMKESHHLYPVLFYFRFAEPFYAISRFTFVALDAASLLRTALAPEYDWVKASGSVQGLARSARLLLETLTENFVGAKVQPTKPDAAEREGWCQRFDRARRKFQQAGIQVRSEVGRAADEYVELRKDWDCFIRRLAPFMAYRIEEIDRVSFNQGR
jgi:hypothetical protein